MGDTLAQGTIAVFKMGIAYPSGKSLVVKTENPNNLFFSDF